MSGVIGCVSQRPTLTRVRIYRHRCHATSVHLRDTPRAGAEPAAQRHTGGCAHGVWREGRQGFRKIRVASNLVTDMYVIYRRQEWISTLFLDPNCVAGVRTTFTLYALSSLNRMGEA